MQPARTRYSLKTMLESFKNIHNRLDLAIAFLGLYPKETAVLEIHKDHVLGLVCSVFRQKCPLTGKSILVHPVGRRLCSLNDTDLYTDQIRYRRVFLVQLYFHKNIYTCVCVQK